VALFVFGDGTDDRDFWPRVIAPFIGAFYTILTLQADSSYKSWSEPIRRGIQTGIVASVYAVGLFLLLPVLDSAGARFSASRFWGLTALLGVGTFVAAWLVNIGVSYALKLPRASGRPKAEREPPSPRGVERKE